MGRVARITWITLGVALSLWLLPASIHIIDWTTDGAVRVAFFAPLWRLWTTLAVAAIAVLAIGVRHRGTGATLSDTGVRHRGIRATLFGGDASRGRGSRAGPAGLNPLALMWLWVVPYLPWLPDRAPALLALSGPLRWVIMALALGGAAAERWAPPVTWRVGRRTVFAVSLATYVGFGLWSAATVGPTADEPHYLIITQSLLRDRDLAIENNHARGDYREYYGSDLHPDFLRRGRNEVIYSIHAPGLPALLLPAYAAAGYTGAVVMMCLIAALAALAVFDLAALVAGGGAASLAWAAVCLTVPFVPHSWLIFPEIPGALIVAWAALWLYAPLPRARTWIWRGAALAVLPWLHTKFAILLAAMGAALFLRVWRTPKAAAALVALPAISVALWFYSFYRLYGVFDPQIPYGDFVRLYVRLANIPRGVLGLLFDQKFGLLMYAPVYLIALAGAWMMLRRPALRAFGIALIITVVVFVASSTRMYMWWGGASAPARFLVPILPLAAPMIALAFGEMRFGALRAATAILLIVSVVIAAAGVIAPDRSLLFSAPHGLSNLLDAAQGDAPLAYLLPTFTEDAVTAPLALLAPWALAGLIALAGVTVAAKSASGAGGFGAAAVGLAVFIVGGAVLAGTPRDLSQRHAAVIRGRVGLMRAYDGSTLTAFDYARGASLGDADLLAMSTVAAVRAGGGLTKDPKRLAGPFNLPAGSFTLRLMVSGASPREGSASVMLADRVTIARGDVSAPLAFELPVDAAVWLAVSDEPLAAAVQQVDITATSIVPRSARPTTGGRAIEEAIEPIASRAGAYIIYGDHQSYPEGGVFWTHVTKAAKVFIAPAGAATLVLTLHLGPAGGPVRLLVDRSDRSLTLSPNETRTVEIAVDPAARIIPIAIEAPGGFRPSDLDAGSTDHRWLGCQVGIGLR